VGITDGAAEDESASKPGSGPGSPYGTFRVTTIHLGLPLPAGSSGPPTGSGGPPSNACAVSWAEARDTFRPCSRWGLPSRPGHPGRWCALTAPFHPYRSVQTGGFFSVALSRGSPRVGVTDHPALWSPDFPRRSCLRRGRPANSSSAVESTRRTDHRSISGAGQAGPGKRTANLVRYLDELPDTIAALLCEPPPRPGRLTRARAKGSA